MFNFISNIPNIKIYPLKYIFENLELQHKPNTLWLEFGVATGNTINYISKFTNDKVYGFDCFDGLPEFWREGFDKGFFNRITLIRRALGQFKGFLSSGKFLAGHSQFFQLHNLWETASTNL